MSVTELRKAAPVVRLRAERLVEENKRLAAYLVQRKLGRGPAHRWDVWKDAEQVAMIALWQAACAWDPARDLEFWRLATASVCNALDRFLVQTRRRGLAGLGDPAHHPDRVEPTTTCFSQVAPPGYDCRRGAPDGSVFLQAPGGEEPGWGPEEAAIALAACPNPRHLEVVVETVMADSRTDRGLARKFGVSQTRVYQTRLTSLAKMRRLLTGTALDPRTPDGGRVPVGQVKRRRPGRMPVVSGCPETSADVGLARSPSSGSSGTARPAKTVS